MGLCIVVGHPQIKEIDTEVEKQTNEQKGKQENNKSLHELARVKMPLFQLWLKDTSVKKLQQWAFSVAEHCGFMT